MIMSFHGLTSFEKCLKLLELLKENKFETISKEELAFQIAKNIGSSKYHNTIRNYISYMIGFKMLEVINKDEFRINYSELNDKQR